VTGTHWRHLAEHDILRNSAAVVELSDGGGLKQDLDRLFKRTSHECTCVRPIDTMTGNSCNASSVCHNVNKQRKMTVIDV
jgi:hypothetical protein